MSLPPKLQTSRLFRGLSGYSLSGIAGVVLVVGVAQIAHFSWEFLARLNESFSRPVAGWIHDYVWVHPDGWLTAIATALLFWATLSLAKLTRRQVAGDSPLLHYTLTAEPLQSGSVPDYAESWEAADKNTTALLPYIGGQPSYIDIRIANEQSKPYGVAVELAISVELRWGAVENVNYHPFRMEREVTIAALGPNAYIEGRVFNVGSIPNYVARITDVSYRDMLKRIRHASYGTGKIARRSKDVPMETMDTVILPKKRELC